MVTGAHPWDLSNQGKMMTQICTADFACPPYLSPECKELIGKLIRVAPDDRMPLDQLLMHPWLKKSADAKILSRAGAARPRPPRPASIDLTKQLNLPTRITSAPRGSATFTIVSPFEASEPATERRSFARSASLEGFSDVAGGESARRASAEPMSGRAVLLRTPKLPLTVGRPPMPE
jgi:serine/threonine protein kinase